MPCRRYSGFWQLSAFVASHMCWISACFGRDDISLFRFFLSAKGLGAGRAQGLAICTAPDFCTLEMPGGNSLAFVRNRPALGVVCRAGHSYIISAKRPYYPYHSGQTVYYQHLQRGERHLVYLAPDRAKFVSSLYRQPPKWHQPPNSGE